MSSGTSIVATRLSAASAAALQRRGFDAGAIRGRRAVSVPELLVEFVESGSFTSAGLDGEVAPIADFPSMRDALGSGQTVGVAGDRNRLTELPRPSGE